MPRRMEPLTVGLLNKGGFGAEMDREFKDLQKQHVGYLQRYGDKAKGSKAKMVVTIELECQEPDTEFFSITTQIKKAIPSTPPKHSTGTGDVDQTDELCLFVRSTGSDYDTPKQQTIDNELKKIAESAEKT